MASPSRKHGHGWKQTSVSRPSRSRKRFRLPSLPKGIWKTAFLLFACLFILGSLGTLGLFAYVSRDLPDPNALTQRTIAQSTKIFDRTGEHLLYEIYGKENRTLVKFQKPFCGNGSELTLEETGVPDFAVKATIAAEDKAFCTHHGFSIKGLFRAVLFGGSRGGGSTLTQQLVKNAILSNEKTLTRKAKELILSIALERRYSKDEILQIYFNEIPYGSTFYGIQAASQNYFGKSVKDLSLAQAATLAALPKAPTSYLNNPDRLKARRDFILDQMAEQRFVKKEEAEAAKQEDTSVKTSITNITAPHFVFYVKELLEQQYGQRKVEEGGLRVITSLDFEKQQFAEEAVRAQVETNGEAQGFTNASLVAIDPKTGQILAMVGSKDYFDDEIDGQVNVSTRLRQPGSSIKPIVYARGFEYGYTPNTVLWDVKTEFPTEIGVVYAPNNYDLKERGPVRVRDALQMSLNIPAVKMLALVGVQPALDFATTLGYTSFSDRSRFGLAIVLGGGEVQLLEHVNAYAAFANDGLFQPHVAILKVQESDGTILEEWKEKEGTRVMKENTARMISNVLSDNNARVPVFGAGSPLQLGGRPVAAKTGTTNDYHDAWTVGYTPSLVAGVWAGNNDNTAMNRAGGSLAAAPIWNAFMRKALENTPVESFIPPSIPVTGKAMLDGALDNRSVTVDRATGKLATEYTPPSMREERLYAQFHSILHYVNTADPLGPPPENPAGNPYYEKWEAAIRDWITRREAETGIKITQAEPPTEYDDIHVPENIPRVRITSPADDAIFDDRAISLSADAEAPRGIRRVDFYLDGFFLGSDSLFPFSLSTHIPPSASRGFHSVKAIAFDDVENSGSDTIGIRVESEPTTSGFEIMDPKNGQTIERVNDEYTVIVSLGHPEEFHLITAYAQPSGVGDRMAIGGKLNPESPFLTFSWQLPPEGEWILTATGELKTGELVDSPGLVVRVTKPSTATPATPPAEGENPPPVPTNPTSLDPFAAVVPSPTQ